jgi:hypothetical protein
MRSPSEIQVFAPTTVVGSLPTPTPLAVLPTGKDYQLVYLPAKRALTHHEIWLIKNKRGKTLFRFTEAIWLMAKDSHQPLVLHDIPTNKGYFFGKDEDRAYRETIEILPKGKNGIQRDQPCLLGSLYGGSTAFRNDLHLASGGSQGPGCRGQILCFDQAQRIQS